MLTGSPKGMPSMKRATSTHSTGGEEGPSPGLAAGMGEDGSRKGKRGWLRPIMYSFCMFVYSYVYHVIV